MRRGGRADRGKAENEKRNHRVWVMVESKRERKRKEGQTCGRATILREIQDFHGAISGLQLSSQLLATMHDIVHISSSLSYHELN